MNLLLELIQLILFRDNWQKELTFWGIILAIIFTFITIGYIREQTQTPPDTIPLIEPPLPLISTDP